MKVERRLANRRPVGWEEEEDVGVKVVKYMLDLKETLPRNASHVSPEYMHFFKLAS